MFNKDLIIELLKRKNWSRYKLSKEANLAQSTLSDILTGKNSNPRMDTIQKIATALDVTVDVFFDDEGNPNTIEKNENEEKINLLGDTIKKLRLDKGMTTYELADLTGIPQSTISKMENGKRKIETDSLQLLAKALKVPISTFFDDNNNELNTTAKSENEEKFHSDIIRIERARRKMPKDEQENMMKVLEAAFAKYFND